MLRQALVLVLLRNALAVTVSGATCFSSRVWVSSGEGAPYINASPYWYLLQKKKTGRQSWSALFSEVKGLNAGAAVGLALLLARRKR